MAVPIIDLSEEDEGFELPRQDIPEGVELIDLEDEDEDEDEIDETPRPQPEQQQGACRRSGRPNIPELRNAPIIHPLELLTKWQFDDRVLVANRTVELKSGDFLNITNIIRDTRTTEVFLRGYQLRRTKLVDGMLPKKMNELCLIYEIDKDDLRPVAIQGLIEAPLAEVKKIRRLTYSNKSFPEGRMFDLKADYNYDQRKASAEGPLVARWKHTIVYPSSRARQTKKHWREGAIERLHPSDHLLADPISDVVLRDTFRGRETILGGSALEEDNDIVILALSTKTTLPPKRKNGHLKTAPRGGKKQCYDSPFIVRTRIPVINLEDIPITINLAPPYSGVSSSQLLPHRLSVPKKACRRIYTFADAFCGAGGMSRAAQEAGFKVVWGCDHWGISCQTWRANFPGATMYEMNIAELIMNASADNTEGAALCEALHVDVLHVSCPCQYYSMAHTVPGRNDEMNTASLFALHGLIQVTRPRIVTLEQTSGIISKEMCREYFFAMIHMLTELEFSVTWKIVPLQEQGVPQLRKRLFVIAACPGEVLPELPNPTHGDAPGLKPFVTLDQTLASVPANARDHDVAAAMFPPDKIKPRIADQMFAKCITTSGGQENYHPSGTRQYTVREFAGIQTFPSYHVFQGTKTNQIKQIGNAVPPQGGRIVLENVMNSLKAADGVGAGKKPVVGLREQERQPTAREVEEPVGGQNRGAQLGRPSKVQNINAIVIDSDSDTSEGSIRGD